MYLTIPIQYIVNTTEYSTHLIITQQKVSYEEPVANHVAAQKTLSSSATTTTTSTTTTATTVSQGKMQTGNHVPTSVSGHTAVNGEHTAMNGEGETNGEMEVSLLLVLCSLVY